MDASVDAASTCGAGLIARVIKVEVIDGSSVVTVRAGSDQGVGLTWTATLVPPRVPATIIRVDQQTATLRLTATMDQIRAGLSVELCPP